MKWLPHFLREPINILFNIGVLILVFRIIVNPMILHFGLEDGRFLAGQRPVLAQKLRYFADGEFRGLFDQAA